MSNPHEGGYGEGILEEARRAGDIAFHNKAREGHFEEAMKVAQTAIDIVKDYEPASITETARKHAAFAIANIINGRIRTMVGIDDRDDFELEIGNYHFEAAQDNLDLYKINMSNMLYRQSRSHQQEVVLQPHLAVSRALMGDILGARTAVISSASMALWSESEKEFDSTADIGLPAKIFERFLKRPGVTAMAGLAVELTNVGMEKPAAKIARKIVG